MGTHLITLSQKSDHRTNFVNKLPQITAAFWMMKITATTLGETGGDWLSMTMNVGYLASTLIFFTLFVIALGFQLKSKKHHPYLYWTVIIATSTAGTTMSDYMDRTLKLGYTQGSAILVTLLLSVLALWRLTVGNVAVDDIRTRKAEVFYWVAILFSNTLGTALGDFLADDSGLGFFGSWLLITGILGVILIQTINITLPRLGGTMMITLIIIGQLLTGVVIDHFGFLGVAVRPVDVTRIIGVIVLLVGGYLISK